MAAKISEKDSISECNSKDQTNKNLMDLVDPPAEMAMSKDDFDHLLFDKPISAAMEQFGIPMTVETTLASGCPELDLESPDSGFCDDQTIMSTDTEFSSVPASPSLPSPFFSNSSSSESGIEEDDEVEAASNFSAFEISNELKTFTGHTEQTFSQLEHSMPVTETSQPVSTSIADAYEELKQLLYTVASCAEGQTTPVSTVIMSGMTTLPSVPTRMNTNFMSGMDNVPVSTVGKCPKTQAVIASSPLTATSNSNFGKLPSMYTSETRGSSSPKCVYKRKRRRRDAPKLVILDEPEENYRARYESEGCRGPIHGSSENTYPTIRVSGYDGPVWITVYLTTSSGLPHYHSIHGPGSTKVPCKEITLPGGVPAVQLMVDPDSSMTAIMDSLSIKRLRNWEGDKELKKRGIDPRTWKRERKEARLFFQAEIPGEDGQPATKLTCKSRIFQCSSSGPTGSPEIWWASRAEGSVEGNEEIGLIGKKFPSDLKVRFYTTLPTGEIWESFAEVDKSKTHQGAAVIHTPPFKNQDILFPEKVNIEIVSGNVKNGKCSEPIEFTYNPRKDMLNASVPNNGQNLGGLLTGIPLSTSTIPLQTIGSPMASIAQPPLPRDNTVIPDISLLTSNIPSPTVIPQPVSRQPDMNDWQRLCIQIKELQQNGMLSAKQIKCLCGFIQKKDLLLLQAFRSANNAGTSEECRTKFKQYLMGLIGNL